MLGEHPAWAFDIETQDNQAPVAEDDAATRDEDTPEIAIAKAPELQYVRRGNSVTFTITLTDTGDVDLH